jgi:hypothetical protein
MESMVRIQASKEVLGGEGLCLFPSLVAGFRVLINAG